MRHKWSLLLVLLGLCSFTIILPQLSPVQLEYPSYWEQPYYNLEKNPLMTQQIALGRKLFYDPILSADSTISCASCHLSYTAFTHTDHALSHGIHDSIGTRNSPVLINIAWQKHFMWDGAINNIEMQGLAPINHASEMGETTQNVLLKLNHNPTYQQQFLNVFGDSIITIKSVLKALAQFQLTFVSANSKYDQVKAGKITFNNQEGKGYQLFLKYCNDCHTEPLFTNQRFENNGLSVDTTLNDWGRYIITQQAKDSLLFKVPTLRNIEFSFPYMHDGRFKSLNQVLDHYQKEIIIHPNLPSQLKNGIPLTDNEKTDVIAFLLTLTDKQFLFNPKFSFPRD